MARTAGRHLFRSILVVALIAGIGFAVLWVRANRVDPTEVPQKQWWQLGTHGPGGEFAGFPKQRKVVVRAPESGVIEMVRNLLPAPLGTGALDKATVMAQFDPESGEIRVVDDTARFLATLPPQLQGPLVHAIRHEYGHACMYDWYRATGLIQEEEVFLAFSDDQQTAAPKTYPKALRPVVEEYKTVAPAVYLVGTFTTSFDEYMAESYARYVSGQSVPPKTKAFFDELSTDPTTN